MGASDYIEPYANNPGKTYDVHGYYHMRFTVHLIG